MAALAALCALPACEDAAGPPLALDRSERFGILRDLELFPRSSRLGGPFFLDRFETTRADWRFWLAAQRGDRETVPDPAVGASLGEDATLPVVGVDLLEARTYARWRLGRVPRYDELLHAASGGGLYRRPWGDVDRASWANTQELAVGGLTPVGAFESGRQHHRKCQIRVARRIRASQFRPRSLFVAWAVDRHPYKSRPIFCSPGNINRRFISRNKPLIGIYPLGGYGAYLARVLQLAGDKMLRNF